MARREPGEDPKAAALREARCLNPHPEQVSDAAFLAVRIAHHRPDLLVYCSSQRSQVVGQSPDLAYHHLRRDPGRHHRIRPPDSVTVDGLIRPSAE
jgi:hypothetical protein